MICARTSRCVVSVWTPSNRTSPSVITNSPIMLAPETNGLFFANLERRLLAGRHGFFRHRQHHRYHDVIARDRRQVHDLLLVEDLPGTRKSLVRDLLRGGQLGNEIIDDGLVLGHAGWTLA